jgi:hypothetical protein
MKTYRILNRRHRGQSRSASEVARMFTRLITRRFEMTTRLLILMIVCNIEHTQWMPTDALYSFFAARQRLTMDIWLRLGFRPSLNWRVALDGHMAAMKDELAINAGLAALPDVLSIIVIGYVPDRHSQRELNRRVNADWTSKLMDAPRAIVQLVADYVPWWRQISSGISIERIMTLVGSDPYPARPMFLVLGNSYSPASAGHAYRDDASFRRNIQWAPTHWTGPGQAGKSRALDPIFDALSPSGIGSDEEDAYDHPALISYADTDSMFISMPANQPRCDLGPIPLGDADGPDRSDVGHMIEPAAVTPTRCFSSPRAQLIQNSVLGTYHMSDTHGRPHHSPTAIGRCTDPIEEMVDE